MNPNKNPEKFEHFINDVLKQDLKTVCDNLDSTNTDLAEYDQLEKTIEMMKKYKNDQKTYKTMVEIGCNNFMQAHIEEYSTILLDIGCQCYLEFPLDRATLFISQKKEQLNKQIDFLRNKSAQIKARIKFMLLLMDKFNNNNIAETKIL